MVLKYIIIILIIRFQWRIYAEEGSRILDSLEIFADADLYGFDDNGYTKDNTHYQVTNIQLYKFN